MSDVLVGLAWLGVFAPVATASLDLEAKAMKFKVV